MRPVDGQGRADRDSGRPAGAHRRRVGKVRLQGEACGWMSRRPPTPLTIERRG